MKDFTAVAYCRARIAKAFRAAFIQTHGIPTAAHALARTLDACAARTAATRVDATTNRRT
jgi:hypothetical protein